MDPQRTNGKFLRDIGFLIIIPSIMKAYNMYYLMILNKFFFMKIFLVTTATYRLIVNIQNSKFSLIVHFLKLLNVHYKLSIGL